MKKMFKKRLKQFKKNQTNESYENALIVLEDILKYHPKKFLKACKKACKAGFEYEDIAEIIELETNNAKLIRKVMKIFKVDPEIIITCVGQEA